MKEKTSWPWTIGVGCLGVIIFTGILVLFFLGGAVGTYLYLKNTPIKAAVTYPVIDVSGTQRDITINLATEKAIPKQDIEAMLKQGQVRGVVQLLGPGDGKLAAVAFTVQLPMDRIVREVAAEARREIGLSQEGDMTKALMSRLKMEMGLAEDKNFIQGFMQEALKQLFSGSPAIPR